MKERNEKRGMKFFSLRKNEKEEEEEKKKNK